MNNPPIVIVGTGPVAWLLALALGRAGLAVRVLEQEAAANSNPQMPPRVSAINHDSLKNLIQQGLSLEALKPHGVMDRIEVWEPDLKKPLVFEAAEVGIACLAQVIENDRLTAVMRAQALSLGTVTAQLAELDHFVIGAEGRSQVFLANGDFLEAALLVGADGARSTVRAKAGIEWSEAPYGHSAIVATIALEKPHRDTAFQVFLPTGPVALLPLADPYQSSLVWSVTPERLAELQPLSDAGFSVELQAVFAERLGKLEAITPRQAFPLCERHAKRYVQPGLALVGDAAHTIHPLAGQGMNLGFADALALAKVLIQAEKMERPLGRLSILEAYERERRLDNTLMMKGMQAFKQAFSAESGRCWPVIRRLGIRWLNQANFLKRYFMACSGSQ
jgi:2-octaprenylphenol hydroxylase